MINRRGFGKAYAEKEVRESKKEGKKKEGGERQRKGDKKVKKGREEGKTGVGWRVGGLSSR